MVGGSLAAFFAGILLACAALEPPAEAGATAPEQAASTSFADELLPGITLHRVHERYLRHGPMADRIASDPCAQPERFYSESWIQVDNDGLASERRGRSTEINGDAYMTSQTIDGEIVHQYANCDREHRAPYTPYSLQEWARRAESAPQKLADLGLEKVGEGDWDGKRTVIYEREYDYSAPSYQYLRLSNEPGYSLPYFDDLEPLYILARYELVVENPLFQRLQRWAVDAGGNKTLVYEKVTILLEVVDQ